MDHGNSGRVWLTCTQEGTPRLYPRQGTQRRTLWWREGCSLFSATVAPRSKQRVRVEKDRTKKNAGNASNRRVPVTCPSISCVCCRHEGTRLFPNGSGRAVSLSHRTFPCLPVLARHHLHQGDGRCVHQVHATDARRKMRPQLRLKPAHLQADTSHLTGARLSRTKGPARRHQSSDRRQALGDQRAGTGHLTGARHYGTKGPARRHRSSDRRQALSGTRGTSTQAPVI